MEVVRKERGLIAPGFITILKELNTNSYKVDLVHFSLNRSMLINNLLTWLSLKQLSYSRVFCVSESHVGRRSVSTSGTNFLKLRTPTLVLNTLFLFGRRTNIFIH